MVGFETAGSAGVRRCADRQRVAMLGSVGSLATGGGSSAVAASAHSACERYRKTDPMVLGKSRRDVARAIGHEDISAGIPEARWMRAITFERLVHDRRFVSQLLTTAVGALGLPRPPKVLRADGKVSTDATAQELVKAHERAMGQGAATMVTDLAVPFVSMEADPSATPVKPDFAIVAPRGPMPDGALSAEASGSWLVMGDAKDYERIRSRIGDHRMLKGFLQVALGAESAQEWSLLPGQMEVHRFGVLAVPRNGFLQPMAVVERLEDHRREVRRWADERARLADEAAVQPLPQEEWPSFVAHLRATYDPATCPSCSLFSYCRTEIRDSDAPEALLAEIGVSPVLRPAVQRALDGSEETSQLPASLMAGVRAMREGLPAWSGQRRIDPLGRPGSIEVVLAKSDAAALGVYGVGVRRTPVPGAAAPWRHRVFDDPQSPATRVRIMELLGEEIDAAMGELGEASGERGPIHLVLPDGATGDLLVSIADSLAGVEMSRLRWARDTEKGRPALTYDGEEAVLPRPLPALARVAVSFLLEADRARAMVLRTPLVDARDVLARHVAAGGPPSSSGRLDYLLRWAEASNPLDHRAVGDEIEEEARTPGARLSNKRSDTIHDARRGFRRGRRPAPDELKAYRDLVREELKYKEDVLQRAVAVMGGQPDSRLRAAYEAIEADAQAVWRARLELHASDLVRFGRTNWVWRNSQVLLLDGDATCAAKLDAFGSPQLATDMAVDAGRREVALAEVVGVEPTLLRVESRSIRSGSSIAVLHVNGDPCVELPNVTLKIQKGSFKIGQLSIGEVTAAGRAGGALRFRPSVELPLQRGDRLVVADLAWFGAPLSSGHQLNVHRPGCDTTNAPKPGCTAESYDGDPASHRYCCRPHEAAEAETSDYLAGLRAQGRLNPEAWPPVTDLDQFDVTGVEDPIAEPEALTPSRPAGGLTIDDLD